MPPDELRPSFGTVSKISLPPVDYPLHTSSKPCSPPEYLRFPPPPLPCPHRRPSYTDEVRMQRGDEDNGEWTGEGGGDVEGSREVCSTFCWCDRCETSRATEQLKQEVGSRGKRRCWCDETAKEVGRLCSPVSLAEETRYERAGSMLKTTQPHLFLRFSSFSTAATPAKLPKLPLNTADGPQKEQQSSEGGTLSGVHCVDEPANRGERRRVKRTRKDATSSRDEVKGSDRGMIDVLSVRLWCWEGR